MGKKPVRLIEPPGELRAFILESTDGLPTSAQVDAWYIDYVLKECGGSRSLAANVLGIDVSTLYRKLKLRGGEADPREAGSITTHRAYISFVGFRKDLVRIAKMLAERLGERDG